MEPQIPPYLPSLLSEPPTDVAYHVLQLYRRIAEHTQLASDAEAAFRRERQADGREADRLIAVLAAQRFEFQRLAERIRPSLADGEAADAERAIRLFLQHWDSRLASVGVTVRDLTGLPVDEAIVEVVDVQSAVLDPAAAVPTVRQTLEPLITRDDRVIALAKVITAVPPQSGRDAADVAPDAAADSGEQVSEGE